MQELYLEVFSRIDEHGVCLAPVETVVTLFTYKYCGEPSVKLSFVVSERWKQRAGLRIRVPRVVFEEVEEGDVGGVGSECKLPVLVQGDGVSAVAGLCGVLRGVVKLVSVRHPLLGFKQSCLYACAETSLWTKFCEVDMVETVNRVYGGEKEGEGEEEGVGGRVEIPRDVARFEVHMGQPVRVHNIQKEKQEVARSEGRGKVGVPDSRLAPVRELEHRFSEGHRMSLADVMLLPGFHVVFEYLGSVFLKQHVPLSYGWYENMLSDRKVEEGLKVLVEVRRRWGRGVYVEYVVPEVGRQSLYKGEVRRLGAKRQSFTRQEDVEECLGKVGEMRGGVEVQERTFGGEVDFDWRTVPSDESQIPAKRVERKGQQLQNLSKAVLKIARNGDRIVDFCSGSGHLGLILAHALPRCTVVLLENKEQSLTRAKERAEQLKLSNVFFCQSNVDYFRGKFNIGVSLHACGVATDLVMERCIEQNAAFVCCPCCYGSIQPNHVLRYPRSDLFASSTLTLTDYLTLAHAADQTHYDDNAKTAQGNRCMAVIDADRCLRAKEAGYWVALSKLDPPSCTPKNNLLVGVPRGSCPPPP